MSITYDAGLEGTAYPNLSISERHENIRRQTLKKLINDIRAMKDTSIDLSTADNDKSLAFIKALELLKDWNTPGATPQKKVELGKTTYNIKGHFNYFLSKIQKARIVIWAEDEDQMKTYYNFSKLPKSKIPNIFNILTGRELFNEDYQGFESADIIGRQLGKVGISFFTTTNRKFRKAQELGGEDLDVEVYKKHVGGFFAYVPLIPVRLEKFGIYSTIKKENYKDSCFVQACIESKVLNDTEIDVLRSIIRTRDVPRGKMRKIADFIKCNFKIIYLNEDKIQDTKHRNDYYMDTTKGPGKQDYGRTITMLLFKEHYMIDAPVMMTPFYIQHYEDIIKTFPNMPLEEQMMLSNIQGRKTRTKEGYKLSQILVEMFKYNRFRPIYQQETDIIKTREYDENTLEDYIDLDYNEELCCQLVVDDREEKIYNIIIYADFESDITVNPHQAYLCCCVFRNPEDNKIKKISFVGYNCASKFLEWVPDNALVYFHNLKYDASFMLNVSKGTYNVNMIEHTGKVMMLKFRQIRGSKKQFTIKDSYCIISAPLRNFDSMFGLSTHKEICPYHVYTRANIKKKFIPLQTCLDDLPEEDHEAFINNCKANNFLHQPNDTVDIIEYAKFYCFLDCYVLLQGLEKFDNDLKEVFETNGKQWDGVKSYLSISAIGYELSIKFGCLEGVYSLSGKPQDFISRCVSGGRTMTANNEKQLIEDRIQDFDAVSLYPSAMSIMPGIPLGKPKVITDLSRDNIMKYDDFYVEITINKIQAKVVKEYRFSLVFQTIDGTKIFKDSPIKHFYIDKRGLMDLEQFYDIEYEVLRGYYFNEGFNNKINDFIKILFDLRAKYKKAKNPIQQTVKLLMNSIYGKSILKPIKTDTKIISPDRIEHFINLNYNFIKEIHEKDGKNAYAKMIKPIDKHFNVPQFGVNVLSWSKHIMNEVMCLADQKGLLVYYQDTDSLHIKEEDVPKLQGYFKEAYNRELIGSNLCQFHCDFDEIEKGVPVHSKKLIALGKKCYVDLLEDEKGNTSYHIRMKGIPQEVIKREAEKRNITIEDLYMILYKGNEITFNLLDGSNCFRKNDFYEMETPSEFARRIQFE